MYTGEDLGDSLKLLHLKISLAAYTSFIDSYDRKRKSWNYMDVYMDVFDN